jgi:hypothetical protein
LSIVLFVFLSSSKLQRSKTIRVNDDVDVDDEAFYGGRNDSIDKIYLD